MQALATHRHSHTHTHTHMQGPSDETHTLQKGFEQVLVTRCLCNICSDAPHCDLEICTCLRNLETANYGTQALAL